MTRESTPAPSPDRAAVRRQNPRPRQRSVTRQSTASGLLLGTTSTSVLVRLVVSLAVLGVAYLLVFLQPSTTAQDGTSRRSELKLLDATTEDLISGLESFEFTSVDLVNAYIQRIREVNSTLRAVVEINPEAVAIAEALDAERRGGMVRGPLHGLPYLIKNNIATQDEMETTAGSYALLGAKVPRDATVVARLRKAGAIILGKTNLSQWANYRSTWKTSTNGWSALGGQVLGPFHKMQDPCGSSSGSGVAAALGLAVASLGTETEGSIICPSASNNLVGIKPTVGLTSRSLVIPISEHQDTVGPMARTVKDAAYILQVIAGKDPHDNYTSAIPFEEIPDYVAQCRFDALRGARIGIPKNMFLPDMRVATMTEIFEASIQTIRRAGATIIAEANVTDAAVADVQNGTMHGRVMHSDFLTNLPNLYLSKLSKNPQEIKSLEQLRHFTQNFELEGYPDRDTGHWDEALEQGFRNTDPEFWPLYQQTLRFGDIEGVLGALQNHSLDALVIPTRYPLNLAARVGAPIVTVPMGHYPSDQEVITSTGNLVMVGPHVPFGLSFIGPKWSEAKLIAYAYAFEQRTQARYKGMPYILPQTELKDVMQ